MSNGMVTINKFNQEKFDKGELDYMDETSGHLEVASVERDSPDYVTVYTGSYYLILNQELIDKLKSI